MTPHLIGNLFHRALIKIDFMVNYYFEFTSNKLLEIITIYTRKATNVKCPLFKTCDKSFKLKVSYFKFGNVQGIHNFIVVKMFFTNTVKTFHHLRPRKHIQNTPPLGCFRTCKTEPNSGQICTVLFSFGNQSCLYGRSMKSSLNVQHN